MSFSITVVFRFLETYVTLLHVKSRLPSPVITETYDQRQLTADDFLFRRQGAQLPMTPTTFTYRFKLILKKNGLPQELNVHSLRHTAASLMIAGGTDVATVAGILGHSQPSTTPDIYTHAFDKNKKAASAGLQGMLEI